MCLVILFVERVAIFYMNKKLLYLFLIVLAGCGKGEKSSPIVFFAGEIVNPTSSHVILYKGDVTIDSAKLDEHNRFSFKLDSISDGLYHFNHAPELQYVYLKQGDSLVARLNTVAFDESLAFSGTGEEINNFLLELFLSNEDQASTINATYRLPPDEFGKKMDSLADLKLNLLKDIESEGVLTVKEIKIAEASIIYGYNIFKEKYPFIHRKYTKSKKIEKLPADFYAYRDSINYGDSDLTYLRPYYKFMNNHFGNMSYMTCSDQCEVKIDIVKNRLHFNIHKLKLIDSMVQEKELKDNLFRNVAFDYLLRVHDIEKNKVFIEQFHALSHNNKHIEEIDGLYEGIKNIQPNKKIPGVSVNDFEGNRFSLEEITRGKKVVFYFWEGAEKKRFKEVIKRVQWLEAKTRDYSFVGINIKTDELNWKGMMKTANLDVSKQYRSENFEKLTHALIIYPMNKCIIAEDGKIVNAFSDIYSNKLEKKVVHIVDADHLVKN